MDGGRKDRGGERKDRRHTTHRRHTQLIRDQCYTVFFVC